ncbi:MAG: amino acid adenylation domain-containing protein, partial [Calditrichaeota bacterium]|nr:amino acid adenylation domain-containing protein [Calditrichota bacterium]
APDVLVGVSLERSVQAIVAILAVWKAGGAYLPLDPDYPVERLDYILRDAGLRYLITQKDVVGKLPVDDQHIFLMDADWPSLGDYNTENPENVTPSEALAYVIYTSGSTGRPKGVMISHHSAYNLLLGLETQIYNRLEQRPLKTSLNAPLLFDASVQQLITLLRGHQLCMIPADVRTDGAALLDFIRKEKIDVLDCVPSQLKLLIEAGLFKEGEWTPQALLPGGEAIDETMWKILRRQHVSQVFNMYGPTECTVDAASCLVTHGPEKPAIGRPLANAKVYILDRYQQPVQIGVIGEICISGDGLSRGYLNRADLTAEKFIPNPFKIFGERLYRTGDLGRFLPDGVIEYIGRLDHQIKLRGYRMELGEIEANLDRHKKIKESVVIVREDAPGDKRLAAYFIPVGEEQPSAPDLREFLRPILPEYMIPSYFVALEKLPLTSNGKLDRKALPKPQLARKDITSEYSEAQTEAEKSLIGIWQTVLGVDSVGVDDNFFELGGDSILSIQVITRAKRAKLYMTPRQLFENPTIKALAAIAKSGPVIHVEQGIVSGEMPATPVQAHFLQQKFKHPHHWNQAVMLEVKESLDPKLVEQVFSKIVEHHDVLRLRVRDAGDNPQLYISEPGNDMFFEFFEISDDAEAQERMMTDVVDKLQCSLSLQDGPILRVAYFRSGEQKFDRLLIIIHHLAIDGISWRILAEDIQLAYSQRAAGREIVLPPKTTSYKYWAEKLADFARHNDMTDEISYWKKHLDGNSRHIPIDFLNGNIESSVEDIGRYLSKDETFTLLHEAPLAYAANVNELLISALAAAYSNWSGSDSLFLQLEGHGREEIIDGVDVSRTVGWFTSLYPARIQIGNQGDPALQVKSVKEQIRSIPNKGIGFGILRYLYQDTKNGSVLESVAEPEIVFNYLGQYDNVFSNTGLFRPVADALGSERSPENHREYLVDISCSIKNGQLDVRIGFSKNIHKETTIRKLLNLYMSAIHRLIHFSREKSQSDYSSVHFESAEIDNEEFENLISELGGE